MIIGSVDKTAETQVSFLLTFLPFQSIIKNKKWVCYRTAIAQAGCSFLFLCLPYHININSHLLHV